MILLDQYLDLRQQIFDHFGYVEDWCVFPINDARKYFWRCDGSAVQFAENKEDLTSEDAYYEDDVYRQRFLEKWIYEEDDYTMILVDTHTDGNKFLRIFDNAKRIV